MEEMKLAAVAHLDGFDLALIPHINSRNSLHIVGLKVSSISHDAFDWGTHVIGALALIA